MVNPIADKITELWESHNLLCYGEEINEFKVTEFNSVLSHTQAHIHTHTHTHILFNQGFKYFYILRVNCKLTYFITYHITTIIFYMEWNSNKF